MKMFRFAALLGAMFTVPLSHVALAQQCAIDFDFGDAVIGISPNPEVGEQFEVGVLGEPYYDVLHILLPTYVNDVDESFAFNDDTLLDSVALSGTSLTNLETMEVLSLADIGLEVVCNNNGDSGNPCSYLGGEQYCGDLVGTPTQAGQFQLDILTTGYITAFNLPFGQESVYGSFVLTIEVPGCTNPEANNFNAEATLDDGSCVVDVLGCMNPEAINFNPEANIQDNSCLFEFCPGDLDGDLTTGVYDLLDFLIAFGCTSECEGEFTGDGVVGIDDLLLMLIYYGMVCI